MRFLIFLISALVAYNAVSIYFLTLGSSKSSSTAYSSPDLTAYFSARSAAHPTRGSAFDSLLTFKQSTVLGSSTSAESPQKTNSQPITHNSPASPAGKQLTIALLGDSMIDTLGPDLPHLKKELAKRFQKTQFTLLNYGAGATNIESGLSRLTNS